MPPAVQYIYQGADELFEEFSLNKEWRTSDIATLVHDNVFRAENERFPNTWYCAQLGHWRQAYPERFKKEDTLIEDKIPPPTSKVDWTKASIQIARILAQKVPEEELGAQFAPPAPDRCISGGYFSQISRQPDADRNQGNSGYKSATYSRVSLAYVILHLTGIHL